MKRLLTLLLCLFLFALPALAENMIASPLVGVWIDVEDNGTLTIYPDGTATMIYSNNTVTTCGWQATEVGGIFTDGMWYNSPMVLLDDNTLSVSNGWMIFAREGFLPTAAPALLLNAAPVGEDGAPFLGQWTLTGILLEGEEIDPSLFGMTMDLTFNADGTVLSEDGVDAYTTTWFVSYGSAVVEGDILTLDENDRLNYISGNDLLIFTRVPTAETDPIITADPAPVGEDGAPFLGTWTLESILIEDEVFDPGILGIVMTITFTEDGLATVTDDLDTQTTPWFVENSAAVVGGLPLTPTEDGKLIMIDEDGTSMVFAQGEAASAEPMSEEDEMLAFLALLEMMGGFEEDLSDLPEEHRGYVGTWHLCYCHTGGLSGDLRSMGLTGELSLYGDYTGSFTGIADEEGSWYEDEGVIRFGESGMPLYLIGEETDGAGLFLQYGTEAGGYMIFHQDEEAVWTPGLYPLSGAVALQTPAAAPAAPGSVQSHLNQKFVCTAYTAAGFTMDASMLGAEYALLFRDNGTVDFTMSGVALPNLPYTITDEGVYAINYVGTMFNCTPTESGFDMDFYGTMTMHFVPAP